MQVKVGRGAHHKFVVAAWKKSEVQKKWEASSWARRLSNQVCRRRRGCAARRREFMLGRCVCSAFASPSRTSTASSSCSSERRHARLLAHVAHSPAPVPYPPARAQRAVVVGKELAKLKRAQIKKAAK
jgi:hypothetical protein